MGAVYKAGQDKQKRVAGIGDVVMAPGNLRGIVIGVNGTFVTVLAIGTSKQYVRLNASLYSRFSC